MKGCDGPGDGPIQSWAQPLKNGCSPPAQPRLQRCAKLWVNRVCLFGRIFSLAKFQEKKFGISWVCERGRRCFFPNEGRQTKFHEVFLAFWSSLLLKERLKAWQKQNKLKPLRRTHMAIQLCERSAKRRVTSMHCCTFSPHAPLCIFRVLQIFSWVCYIRFASLASREFTESHLNKVNLIAQWCSGTTSKMLSEVSDENCFAKFTQ